MQINPNGSTQIIFVGGTWDAANKSFHKFKDKDLGRVIGIFSEKSKDGKSKENWEHLKERILEIDIPVEEFETDYENLEAIFETLRKAYEKCGQGQKIVNITGLSKIGSIGVFIYYALMGEQERADTEFVWLSMNGSKETLPPSVVFAIAKEKSGKPGRTKTTGWVLMEYLANQKDKSATLTELAKWRDCKKPSILEIMKEHLEKDKLVFRSTRGRETVFTLNEFAYILMKHARRDKEKTR